MHYQYNTTGVCPTAIEFDIENDVISKVEFKGGCNGNLKGISVLIEGVNPEEAIKRLEGIKCGHRTTSCPDQLAKALKEIL